MDPVANIVKQRGLAAAIQAIQDSASPAFTKEEHERLARLAVELADHVLALDEWRRRGGFDPYANIPRLED